MSNKSAPSFSKDGGLIPTLAVPYFINSPGMAISYRGGEVLSSFPKQMAPQPQLTVIYVAIFCYIVICIS